MSLLSITDVQVTNPNSKFEELLEFKISINCMEHLPGELEWNLIYVGSSESNLYDQIIDNVSVGPIPPGNHEFNFNAENPIDPKRIQEGHLLGPTVLILNAAYNNQEFVRVGYYVNIFYESQELNESPPEVVDFSLLKKEILASEPRVTRFKINWTESEVRYSISDTAMESDSGTVAAGMTDEQLMAGQDENVPPVEMFAKASENSILSNRLDAIMAGLNDNSNSSLKAGGLFEANSTSMDANKV